RLALAAHALDVRAIDHRLLRVSLPHRNIRRRVTREDAQHALTVLGLDEIADVIRRDLAARVEDAQQQLLLAGVAHGHQVRPDGVAFAASAVTGNAALLVHRFAARRVAGEG